MRIVSFFILVMMLAFFSCKQKEDPVFEKLVGTWKRDDVNEFERWTRNNDGTYTSVMFSLNKADTVFSEIVKIYASEPNQWIFEVSAAGQNNGVPVKFHSTLLNPTQVTFENTTHDFPNFIHYSMVGTLKLQAFIAGKGDTVRFNFTRLHQ